MKSIWQSIYITLCFLCCYIVTMHFNTIAFGESSIGEVLQRLIQCDWDFIMVKRSLIQSHSFSRLLILMIPLGRKAWYVYGMWTILRSLKGKFSCFERRWRYHLCVMCYNSDWFSFSLLTCESQPRCVCFAPTKTSLVFSGMVSWLISLIIIIIFLSRLERKHFPDAFTVRWIFGGLGFTGTQLNASTPGGQRAWVSTKVSLLQHW